MGSSEANDRDQIFKAKSKKIDKLLTKSRDDLIHSLREKVKADRDLKVKFLIVLVLCSVMYHSTFSVFILFRMQRKLLS